MRLYEEEARWSILRSEMRTYTQLLASAHRDELVQMIPDYYNYIGDYCFKNNGKIKEVLLPLGCKIIGREAFSGCQFRKSVSFPETMIEIKSGAFSGNHQLQKAEFQHPWLRYGNSAIRIVITCGWFVFLPVRVAQRFQTVHSKAVRT